MLNRTRRDSFIKQPQKRSNLATLALLHPQIGSLEHRVVAAIPVDLLDGVVAVAVDGEPRLAVVGQVAVIVDAEAIHVAAVGHGGRVGDGHAHGQDSVLDDIQVLERSGNGVLGEEGDGAIRARADCTASISLGACMMQRTRLTDGNLLVSVVAAAVAVEEVGCRGLAARIDGHERRLTAVGHDGVSAVSNQSEGLRERRGSGGGSSAHGAQEGSNSSGELHVGLGMRKARLEGQDVAWREV